MVVDGAAEKAEEEAAAAAEEEEEEKESVTFERVEVELDRIFLRCAPTCHE